MDFNIDFSNVDFLDFKKLNITFEEINSVLPTQPPITSHKKILSMLSAMAREENLVRLRTRFQKTVTLIWKFYKSTCLMKKTLESTGAKTTEKKEDYFEIVSNNHNPANQMSQQELIQLILDKRSEKLKKTS